MDKTDCLKLENQLCFPLYAASRNVIRKYKKFLDELDLTYTQYIAMMVLWENEQINVKELGKKLYLDSGTLTPLLKTLENKGYISRVRSSDDERNLLICLTENGYKLKDKASKVPQMVSKCINLDAEDAINLYKILYKILESGD